MLQNVTQLRIEWQAFENQIHFTKQLAQGLNSRPYVCSGYINQYTLGIKEHSLRILFCKKYIFMTN
jgi:hypothetical protein